MIEVDGEPVVIHSRVPPSRERDWFSSPRTAAGAGAVSGAGGAGEHHHGRTLERDATFGMLNRKSPVDFDGDAIALLNIRVPHSRRSVPGGLSGGKSAKALLISRWGHRSAHSDPWTNRRGGGRRREKRDLPHHEPDGAPRAWRF